MIDVPKLNLEKVKVKEVIVVIDGKKHKRKVHINLFGQKYITVDKKEYELQFGLEKKPLI